MTTTIYSNPTFSDTPLGLPLRQVITSSGSVTIPSHIKRVYAVCIGGGGGGGAAIPNRSTDPFTITNAAGTGTTVTYICNNNFTPGLSVTITGVNPGVYNITGVVASATPTSFKILNTPAGTYITGGTVLANAYGGMGGGGAGAFSAGWTWASNTCIVGAGGTGGNAGISASSGGGNTVYGMVIAGGGGRGISAFPSTEALTPSVMGGAGGGGGGGASNTIGGTGVISYTGAPAGNSDVSFGGIGGTGYAAGGGGYAAGAGGTGISGGGGGGNNSMTGNAGGGGGGSGLIGGGAGSIATSGTVTASNGGAGAFAGGSGSSNSATITGVVGNGTTVTYNANNGFSDGQTVTITGVTPSAYNLTNATIVNATPTQFVVVNSATGTYSSGGTAVVSTGLLFGAGGGGSGFLGAGGNARGVNGGNGGMGGGGGGAAGANGRAGDGGSGVILLYY